LVYAHLSCESVTFTSYKKVIIELTTPPIFDNHIGSDQFTSMLICLPIWIKRVIQSIQVIYWIIKTFGPHEQLAFIKQYVSTEEEPRWMSTIPMLMDETMTD